MLPNQQQNHHYISHIFAISWLSYNLPLAISDMNFAMREQRKIINVLEQESSNTLMD
jgi:hypothetical protein